MAKTKKNPFGKVIQISAAGNELYDLTSAGRVFRLVDDDGSDMWAELSDICDETVLEDEEDD